MKKVCFFGIFDPEYSRNRVLIHGFEQNDCEVTLCRVDPKIHQGFSKYLKLCQEYRKIKRTPFDLVVVGYPGQTVVWLAWLLFGKKIIFDAFLSLHDSNVKDRKIYPWYHPKAFKDWLLDYYSCFLARRVLLDTREHILYFNRAFSVPIEKCIRVLVGSDERIFYPRPRLGPSEKFTIHFHGYYIPLQGIEYIVEAARVLRNENIQFNLIGRGQQFEKIQKEIKALQLKNIASLDKVPLEELPVHIAKADVCLGIFGESEKAARVISNKIYECAAMGKPIVTADTAAIRELFTGGRDIILCRPRNSKDLAKKILELKNDPARAEAIGTQAGELFKTRLVSRVIVRALLNELQ